MSPLFSTALLAVGLLSVSSARAAEPATLAELPPWQTFALLEEATVPMHWFHVDFLSVERCSCEVGVPVDGQGEPRLSCWYPGAYPSDVAPIPRELRPAARQAARSVRAHLANDDERPRHLQVRALGTWRLVLLRDVVVRAPGSLDKAVLTTTRAGYRVIQTAGGQPTGLELMKGGPLGQNEGGTGLYCYGAPCRLNGLLDWVPPADLDGSSVLYGLVFEDDERAQAAWPSLERAALAALTAMDASRWTAPPVVPRDGPGAGSRGVSWRVNAYGRSTGAGQQVSDQVWMPFDLRQAVDSPLTIRRWMEALGVDVTARVDLAVGQLSLVVAGPAGDSAEKSWPLKMALADHAAVVGSTQIGSSLPDVALELTSDPRFARIDVFADTSLHPLSLAPPLGSLRVPVAAERVGDELKFTEWEWLDPGVREGRVLGTKVEFCAQEGREEDCSGLLQGGAELQPVQRVNLPPGPLRVQVEVFETDVPPQHLWMPGSGDLRSLWRANFVVLPAAEGE